MLLSQDVEAVLLLDADRRVLGNPLPGFVASGADVAGMRDEAFLNFGLLYLRNSVATRALITRVANRSLAAWDQAVLAEELAATRPETLSCCHANRWVRRCVRIEESMHRLNKDVDVAQVTQTAQANPCSGGGRGGSGEGATSQALAPPSGSSRLFLRWNPIRYNELSLSQRRYSRCTRIGCAGEAPPACNASSSSDSTGALATAPRIPGSVRMPPGMAPSVHGGLRCTTFPIGTEGLPDANRCAAGNSRRDGFDYLYNAGRGTASAVCGKAAMCACCRRPSSRTSDFRSSSSGSNQRRVGDVESTTGRQM